MSRQSFCPLGQNNLIRTLPPSVRGILEPFLKPVDLTHLMLLSSLDTPPARVFFPISGMASIIAATSTGRRIETGVFGNEGMSATVLLMGSERCSTETVVQVPGSALALPADRFRELMREVPMLHSHLLLFAQTLFTQSSQTALANGHIKVERRLARWLLMCHDRTRDDAIGLTHQSLSVMLGVRRAGVSVATQALGRKNLIRTGRGVITILDRAGLEDEADGTYGKPEAEYWRLFGPYADDPLPNSVQLGL